jgi:hypothetical protein
MYFDYLDSVIINMKTVIQVWTHSVKNLVTTENYGYWGIGDIIRGTIKLFQLSKRMNFRLIVDIQLHPISAFLSYHNHEYSDLIKNNKNDINFIFPNNVENYINNCDENVIYFVTNDQCNDFLTDECKAFIKNIFIPNDIFSKYMAKKNKEIPYENYNILHYRAGDAELVRRDNIAHNDAELNCIVSNMETNDIFICDSINFKNFVKNNTNIFMFDIQVAHMGYHKNKEHIIDTLFEFFVIMNSKKIKTHSVYPWTSGFVYWIHKIYDIPLQKI